MYSFLWFLVEILIIILLNLHKELNWLFKQFELLLQDYEVMYRAMQCIELRLHIKRVRDYKFVFCVQIHTLAGNYTMNSK